MTYTIGFKRITPFGRNIENVAQRVAQAISVYPNNALAAFHNFKQCVNLFFVIIGQGIVNEQQRGVILAFLVVINTQVTWLHPIPIFKACLQNAVNKFSAKRIRVVVSVGGFFPFKLLGNLYLHDDNHYHE